MLQGNQIFPFKCECGKGLSREREIQEHSQSCPMFNAEYSHLLQAFVSLKLKATQKPNTIGSYQAKMNLCTLLTSFRADIKEHMNREHASLSQQ